MQKRIAVAALLAGVLAMQGCGAQETGRQIPASVLGQAHRASTSSGDLLYVADPDSQSVYMFSLPQGILVGRLKGFQYPDALCSDRKGNVFVVDTERSAIYEYAHGSSTVMATLSLDDPMACSVSQTDESLAVIQSNQNHALGVAVFKRATGTPIFYYSKFTAIFSCAYDDHNNLFIDGDLGSRIEFLELAHGSNALASVTMINSPFMGKYFPFQMQWDGEYVAIQNPYHETIVRVAFKNAIGTVESTVHLQHAREQDTGRMGVGDGMVAVPMFRSKKVKLYRYPKGGKAAFQPITASGFETPIAATVSVAPK